MTFPPHSVGKRQTLRAQLNFIYREGLKFLSVSGTLGLQCFAVDLTPTISRLQTPAIHNNV